MKDEVKVFDALKARKVLERVNKFLGVLIRENLVKDAPFLNDGELENESDLADDVCEVLLGVPRNCDVGTAEEQLDRYGMFCQNKCQVCENRFSCHICGEWYRMKCMMEWAQMPYEEGGEK